MIAALLAAAAAQAGCNDRACFKWSKSEGSCPGQKEALAFMTPTCDEQIVQSVDSDGELEDDNLCCYDVTKNTDQVYSCDSTPVLDSSVGESGFSSGDVAPPPPESCVHCQSAFEKPGVDASIVCPPSLTLLNDLFGCACGMPCAERCLDSSCSGLPPSPDCSSCLSEQCGEAFAKCENDF